jgi:hypothetical protein
MPSVWRHLVDFGYGVRSLEYGQALRPMSLESWRKVGQDLVFNLLVLHCAVIAAGAAAYFVVAALAIRRVGLGSSLAAATRSKVLPITVFVGEATAAWLSSPNRGSAFLAPIVPAAIVLAAWSLDKVSAWRPYRYAVDAVICAVAILAFAPRVDLRAALARPWIVNVPGLGPARVADGRGTDELYVLAIQLWNAPYGLAGSQIVQPISRDNGKAWVDLSGETVLRAARIAGPDGVTAIGFRHYLYNINTMTLQSLQDRGRPFLALFVDPFVSGNSVADYVAWLTIGEAAKACLLLTARGDAGEFPPPISGEFVEEAARRVGFAPVETWSTPDARPVTLWRRERGEPHCESTPVPIR